MTTSGSWRLKFLTSEAEVRIESRIQSFERKTGAELKIAVLRASSRYPAAFWRAATFGAFLSACFFYELHALERLFPGTPEFLESQWTFFIGFAALTVGVGSLANVPFLRRLFITEKEVVFETREKAEALFHTLKLSETSHRAGILIQVSLLEHDLELLVDEGISKVTTQKKISTWIQAVTSEFKRGHFEDGLHQCINALENEILTAELNLPTLAKSEISNHLYWGEA